MGSISTDPGELSHPDPPLAPPSSCFEDFQRQTSLMTSCTLLWKELSDHFTSLEQDLLKKSEALKTKLQSLDDQTQHSLKRLEHRESSLKASISLTLAQLEQSKSSALSLLCNDDEDENPDGVVEDGNGTTTLDVSLILKPYCVKMQHEKFWEFVVLRKKEIDVLKAEVPKALRFCIDPPRFVLKAISEVFPVDKREVVKEFKCGGDLGWACVLLLESLVPVLEDPVLGKDRMWVSPKVKEEASEVAEAWKKGLEERGGIDNVKTPDVHTFLQHLVTFGIVKEEDLGFYRKLVVASAWRKQMPKLAVSLGLGDKMPDMIEELISRGQQVDAVHFTYEVGLVDKFPPVPLLKSFLKDAKKAATSILEDPNNSGRAAHLAAKKEQSALRAVIKCIEEYKLEAEFPPETLKKRLEQLEKAKTEKRKPAAVPANKRTRASTGGPMPPAKAGRLTNAYVSSFPAAPTYIRSPTHGQYPAAVPAYPAPPAMYGHGSRSPSYPYSPEPAPPTLSYPSGPVNYPAYGGYGNGIAPAYQQAYY